MKKHVWFKKQTLVFISIIIVSCSQVKDEPVLTIAISSDIRGFDPAMAVDIRTGGVISLVYDHLVRFGSGTELLPSIAKEWSISEDGRTYTFSMNPSARFHDETYILAQDVIFSIKRVLDPTNHSPQTWLFDKIVGAKEFMEGKTKEIKGLEARNDYTLRIEIIKPFAPFIQYLAMPSAAIVNSSKSDKIRNVPAGSGPWKLDYWEKDGELVFSRNDDYWGEPPIMSGLKIRILSETLTQSAEFEVGNLDIFNIPALELLQWTQKKEWRDNIFSIDELNIWYIAMNCSRKPFDDVRVRKAMNISLDREKILRLLLANTGIQASGPVPPLLLRNSPPNPYPYDPTLAIELLKSAGHGNGFQTKLWAAGGSEIFHVLEAFQSYWGAIGIEVEIMRSDWNVFKTAVRAGRPDLYYLDWFADYPDGENFLFPLFHSSESMTKRNRYKNPEVDKLIETIQLLPIGNQRDSLIEKTNRVIFNEAPWVFLWHSQTNMVTQSTITGYVPKTIFNSERYTNIVRK